MLDTHPTHANHQNPRNPHSRWLRWCTAGRQSSRHLSLLLLTKLSVSTVPAMTVSHEEPLETSWVLQAVAVVPGARVCTHDRWRTFSGTLLNHIQQHTQRQRLVKRS